VPLQRLFTRVQRCGERVYRAVLHLCSATHESAAFASVTLTAAHTRLKRLFHVRARLPELRHQLRVLAAKLQQLQILQP
jgi:hypothetical protein